MSDPYQEAVAAATQLIADAVLKHEPNLAERARTVDSIVLGIVRQVGLSTTDQVLNRTAAAEAVHVATSEGLTPYHQETTLFLPSSAPSRSPPPTSGARTRRRR